MPTFGERLHYYRESALELNQKHFAELISANALYHITARQIDAWENNQELDKITDSVLSLIVTTVEQIGVAKHNWDYKQIMHMTRDLAEAIKGKHKLQFGALLTMYRTQLGLTQGDFLGALGVQIIVDHESIKRIENGGSTDAAFVIASYDLFRRGTSNKTAVLADYKSRADYLHSGFSAIAPVMEGDTLTELEKLDRGSKQLRKEVRYLFSSAGELLTRSQFGGIVGIDRSSISRIESSNKSGLPHGLSTIIARFEEYGPHHFDTHEYEKRLSRLKNIVAALAMHDYTSSAPDHALMKIYNITHRGRHIE